MKESAPSENIHREKQAETFLRFTARAENIPAFHGEKLESVFQNEQHKRKFIEAITDSEFLELLNGVNGILRDKPKEEWEMDGERVVLESMFLGVGYQPPRHEDKPGLLGDVCRAAKRMNIAGRDLKDIALLVSASINAIHAYADSNGRESRLFYVLLTENYGSDVQDKIRKILVKYGRDEVDINPGFIEVEIEKNIDHEIGLRDPNVNMENIRGLWSDEPLIHHKWEKLVLKENNDPEKIKLISELLDKDNHFMLCSFFKYVNEHLQETKKYLRKFPKHAVILVDIFCKDASSEQLGEILDNYRSLKKTYIRKLIDVIEQPDNHKIKEGETEITLKEIFERQIEKTRLERQKDRKA